MPGIVSIPTQEACSGLKFRGFQGFSEHGQDFSVSCAASYGPTHRCRSLMKTLKTAVLGSLFLGAALGLSAAADQAIAEKNSRGAQWIGTWATAAQPFLPGALETYQNQSLRLIVHTSAGGARVRIKISNTYGDEPLIVGGAHIGRRRSGADIEPTSDRPLTFGSHSSIAVPAHSVAESDPVNLDVPALSDLAISLFFPRATKATTSHALALQTSYVSS